MKRAISLILLVLTLTSCAGKEKIEPKLSNVSFVAEISYYNENYSADCTIDNEGKLKAVIRVPETLEGFTLTVSDKGVEAEYLGIKYTPTDGNMPFASVIKQVYDRLNLVSTMGETKKEDKEYIRSFGEGAEKTTLHLTEAGYPILLRLPDERFFIEFYNVTVLNN